MPYNKTKIIKTGIVERVDRVPDNDILAVSLSDITGIFLTRMTTESFTDIQPGVEITFDCDYVSYDNLHNVVSYQVETVQ